MRTLPSRRGLAAMTVATSLLAASGAALAADVLRVPLPSFPPAAATVATAPDALRLTVTSSRPNTVLDVRSWFERNRIVPDEWAVDDDDVPAAALPAPFARSFRGLPLRRAIRDRDLALLLYGRDLTGGRFVVGADRRTGATRFAVDLESLAVAPQTPRRERGEARQRALWAAVRDGVLYVETAHQGYARSSAGRNAYLTAIDLDGGRVRWRSPALVANAGTFALVGDAIVTGYGFTAEPDALYVLDRATGRPLRRVAVPSSPEYLAVRRGRLYVRTYDHDLVVRLAVPR